MGSGLQGVNCALLGLQACFDKYVPSIPLAWYHYGSELHILSLLCAQEGACKYSLRQDANKGCGYMLLTPENT